MADALSFGRLDIPATPEKPTSATPFRIAYLADLTGRAHRGETGGADDIADRAATPIRRDDFDDVLAALEPKLEIPVPGTKKSADLTFSTLDDFGPDGVWERTDPLFRKLASDDDRTAKMRGLLHHVEFQALERAWRGVDWLLRRVAKDEKVEVVLFDVSAAEIAADLEATEDLAETGVHRLLAKAATGKKAKPWGLVFADVSFEPDAAGAALLGRLAKIAASFCAPACVSIGAAALDPSWKQDEDTEAAWADLRALPEASFLAVGALRFVLRSPWGGSNSIERFEFEEMSSPPKPEEYVWGSPGLACAALVAGAFIEKGWSLKPAAGQLGKMPMHVFEEDGEKTATVSEAWLESKHLRRLEAAGLSPFVAVKAADAIQATTLQCIAGRPLSGRWGHAAGVAKAESSRPAVGGPKMNLGAGRLPPSSAGDDEPPPRRAKPAPEPEAPSDEPPAAVAPAEPSSEADAAPAADSGGDADLDALMKSLDAPAEDAPAETPAESSGDADLDALMKSLEAPADDASAETPAESSGDADLDALMKSLESPSEDEK
ncbi:MAG: type VI secretion system contractile sheath large subunit [Planctomycetes bacterium]|nr:type VI secretion system contractile sheath large subunit [Planctomycetota bacterium]